MQIVDNIWATYCNMKYKGYLLELLVEKYQRLDRNVNIFLALASSGSIAAWAVWKTNPLIWSAIIATSQVITTIKPYFPYNRITKELNSRSLKLNLLNNEYARLWNKVQRGKLTEDALEQYYFDYNNSFTEILNLPEDLVFGISNEIKQKAEAQTKSFLKTYHK